MFDIVFYNEQYSSGHMGECYVVMGDEYIKEKDDAILVMVEPNNRHLAISHQLFEVQSNYNKLYYSFGKYEGTTDFTLRVILLRKRGSGTDGYRLPKPINII